jgi:cytochrome c-type biogenesis protein
VAALNPAAVRWRIAWHSLAFIAGLSSVFMALGFSAGLVSDVLFDYGDALRIGAGALLIALGLALLRLLPIPWLQHEVRLHWQRKPAGYLGSAAVGVAFGAGWTPCIGPILAGILLLAAQSSSSVTGGLLLGAYSLGFAVPFFLAAQALPLLRRFARHSGLIEKVGGVMLIAVGVLLLSNAVAAFSPYLASLGSVEGALAGNEPTFLLAFVAGALSFLSPCVLPILPPFLAYLTGLSGDELYASKSSAPATSPRSSPR